MDAVNAGNHNWTTVSPVDSALHSQFQPELGVDLMAAARAVKEKAYSPYSKFKVGAAAIMIGDNGEIGDIHSGCNVENASYGATMCAERSSIFSAVAAGGKKICLIALTLDSVNDADLSRRSPCGLCRQVISEFATASSAIVIDSGKKDGFEFTGEVLGIADLLPWGFQFSENP